MRSIIAIIFVAGLVFSVVGAQNQSSSASPAEPTPGLSAEAEVCTAVVDHMPSGAGTRFSADVASLCCWSRITGAVGEINIKHVWVYEGQTMAVVDLPVRGTPWRTHSQKKILPQWSGRWEVRVTDLSGSVLKSIAFTVGDTTVSGQ